MSEYLQKIVYLTESQYATLAGGGTVGSQTGLNDNYIYMTDGKVSLTDIDSSFILPVNLGGTGAASWASGKILAGNGSDTFTTIDKATANTANTLVQRDGSGNFSAGTITAALSGNATSATKVGNASMWLYSENNNEINFGGNNASSNSIYFGFRAKDSKTIPTKFIFGGSTGTADLQVKTVYLGSGTTSYISNTSSTLNGSITITKAGECGLEVNNTQSSNPNQVAFIVGSSGKGGIYSRKHSKWIVYSDANGNILLEGNANTASTLKTGRTLQVALNLTSASTAFTGAANISDIGVSGTLGIANGGTGATTASDAAAQLGFFKHDTQGITLIGADSDLNADTFKVPGTYNSNSSTITGTLVNSPISGSGFKLFVGYTYNIYRPFQIAWGVSQTPWIRVYDDASSAKAWMDWAKIIYKTGSAGIGNSTTPVYVNANGQIQQCDSYPNTATSATYLLTTGRLTNLDVDFGSTINNSKFFISHSDTSTTAPKPAQNSIIMNFAWDNVNGNKYGSQLAIHNQSTPHLQIRGCTNGTWDENWITILDSSNYTSYAPTLSAATTDVLGGVKIGYSTNGKNYAIQLDNNSKMYVNVPWTENTDTKVNYVLDTTTTNKQYLMACNSQPTATATARTALGNTNIYMRGNGLFNAGVYTIAEHVTIEYNNTDQCLDFTFS